MYDRGDLKRLRLAALVSWKRLLLRRWCGVSSLWGNHLAPKRSLRMAFLSKTEHSFPFEKNLKQMTYRNASKRAFSLFFPKLSPQFLLKKKLKVSIPTIFLYSFLIGIAICQNRNLSDLTFRKSCLFFFCVIIFCVIFLESWE